MNSTSSLKTVRDYVSEKLDEMADICEHWKRHRENGRNPTAIRTALLQLAQECSALTLLAERGETGQRRIVCAANRDRDGLVIVGVRHWDAFMHAQADSQPWVAGHHEQGFIDQFGVFMSRTEAWRVASAAGQIIRRVGGDNADGGTLYSENLY